MFRLKATLVATSPMRPWRTGWSVDRGVDFSLAATARPVTAPLTVRVAAAAAERACFMDEDQLAPADAAVVRTFVSAAAAEAAREPPADETPETPGVRGWWSLAGKPSRT